MSLKIEISSPETKPKEWSSVPSKESKVMKSLPQMQKAESWSQLCISDKKGMLEKKRLSSTSHKFQNLCQLFREVLFSQGCLKESYRLRLHNNTR